MDGSLDTLGRTESPPGGKAGELIAELFKDPRQAGPARTSQDRGKRQFGAA
jgi:hypothetical protein